MAKKRIAFIGLGRMGIPMAARLLEQDYEIAVYNRTMQKAEGLVARGARPAENPGQAAEDADIVFSMVADDKASKETYF